MTGGRLLPSERDTHPYRAHEPDIDRAAERLSRAASAASAGAADAGVRTRHRAGRRHRGRQLRARTIAQGRARNRARRRAPRTDDPARLLFRPLEPFLVEGNAPVRPGQIRRTSLLPVWQWLDREGAPDAGAGIRSGAGPGAGAGTTSDLEVAVRKFQHAAADAIFKIATPVPGGDHQRAMTRIGPPKVIEDLLPIGCGAAGPRSLDTLERPAARVCCACSRIRRSPR